MRLSRGLFLHYSAPKYKLKYIAINSTHSQLSNEYMQYPTSPNFIFRDFWDSAEGYYTNQHPNEIKIHCNSFYSVRPFQRAINHPDWTYRSAGGVSFRAVVPLFKYVAVISPLLTSCWGNLSSCFKNITYKQEL